MSDRIGSKKDPGRRSLKFDAWPEVDRQAWQSALREGDVFEPGGVAASWAPKTQRKVVECYGRWLTWLALNGLLDPGSGPAERTTPANVARYVADLQALHYGSYTVLALVWDLHNALRAMAPEHDSGSIRRIAGRLRRTVESVRDKRGRLVPTDQLFSYGLQLMIEVGGTTTGTPLQRAGRYRDGLIIALLAARPLRRRNFASIEIGRHLIRQADGYWLRFEGKETKTRAPIDTPFPDALVPYLERYLTHYRPLLAGRMPQPGQRCRFRPPAMALWVSIYCSAMSDAAIDGRIRDLTKAKFGRSMSPHLFRDSAATTIATEDPEHVYITKSVLGHSFLATSEKHYNHARSLQALRRYQTQISALRQRKSPPDRGKIERARRPPG